MALSVNNKVKVTRRLVPDVATPLHGNPLVHRVMAARGVADARELAFSLADLPKPDSLLGIDLAVERLLEARLGQQSVLIVGDYDCDGATSTALAVLALHELGYEKVEYLVPNRFEYGYGLSPAIVDVAAMQSPDLIVTVDNGVASVDGVERANALGMDVVVTDHHLPPPVLPRAVAVVNPSIPGATFPSSNLAGVGVIFYVLLALRARLQQHDIGKDVKLADYLDLVAIGTVADVVPLDNINRTLVEQGIRRIRRGVTRPGVLALLARAGRPAERFSSVDIGFGIGPRLNAAGRIDDMTRGIECLMTEDALLAQNLSAELDSLNKQRRSIEQGMREEAEQHLQALDGSHSVEGVGEFSVVLFEPGWHQGVIGILAGRLKEQLHKPVVIFAEDADGGIKGSARSIPGVHIRDVLDAIATANPDMIEKFGGHAMAAGLSLPQARLSDFMAAFDAQVEAVLGGVLPDLEWLSDGSLDDSERTLANAELLASISPWGQSFSEPLFDDLFMVESTRVVGKGHLQLSLRSVPADGGGARGAGVSGAGAGGARPSVVSSSGAGERYKAIAFNQTDDFTSGETVHVVYTLSANHYQGSVNLQLMVKHIESAS